MNMRTEKGQEDLKELLRVIGNGLTEQIRSRPNGRPKFRVDLKEENLVRSLDDAIEFCFPSALFDNPLDYAELIGQNAILCPKNDEVKEINEKAMEKLHGVPWEFESIDEPLESQTEFFDFRSNFNLEHVHTLMPSGMPPHKLTLKVGFIIFFFKLINWKINSDNCIFTLVGVCFIFWVDVRFV